MKVLLLISCCSVSTVLLAQEFQPDIQKLIRQKHFVQPSPKFKTSINKRSTFVLIDVPNQRVRPLPQDGLPCLVPDTTETASIPNMEKDYQFPMVSKMPGIGNKKSLLEPEPNRK